MVRNSMSGYTNIETLTLQWIHFGNEKTIKYNFYNRDETCLFKIQGVTINK